MTAGRGAVSPASVKPFTPPWLLRNGWTMTLYAAWLIQQSRHRAALPDRIRHREHMFQGEGGIPLHGEISQPAGAGELLRGTVVGTYGITGSLDQQWTLQMLRRKALDQGYSVVVYDWRAHGKTADLSPTLTSDGLYEGKDFIHIAAQARDLGCPPPFWFTGYSLGGQLALWAVQEESLALARRLGLSDCDIGGAAVICPNLDSNRSLAYLVRSPLGRLLEQSITKALQRLAERLYHQHPGAFDRGAIARAQSIRQFDHELVIPRLGLPSVEEYYERSSPLPWLSSVQKSVLILYAMDDPMFDPAIIPDLQRHAAANDNIDLYLTPYGGHVGYVSSGVCQRQQGDPDPWWAWNRILEWISLKEADRHQNLEVL